MDLPQANTTSIGRDANTPAAGRLLRYFADPHLAARYDAAAPRWHRTMRRYGYPQAYRQLFARLQKAAWLRSLGSGGRVLECGIGTGIVSLAFASVAPVRAVVGVDIAPGMLREAAANLTAAGVAAEMQRADAHRLTHPDASFDAGVSAHMLEHLERPEQAIAEMARVLRPGAPLVIIATRGNFADALIRLKWRHGPIGRDQLIAWMRAARLESIADYDIGDAFSPTRWLSHALVGRKS